MQVTGAIDFSLWSMALSGQSIDACAIAIAIEHEASQPEDALDFRTRLLIRDGINALEKYWGKEKTDQWLGRSSVSAALNSIRNTDLGEPGFPSLTHRIMERTKKETVLQFLRELGLHCPNPARLEIGGAIAAILAGMLSRHTEEIDIVDEIPAALRSQHEMLRELAERYGLRLTHFQTHYLPAGWQNRLHWFDRFGNIEVYLVDSSDLFIGKLFSKRAKDRDDLRAMAREINQSAVETRLRESASAFMSDARLAQFARDNWYILYGEPLPT